MKGGKTPAGYTIVEVMIVLAVSGMMFLMATNFINGKQEQTTFPLAVNTLASNLQNTLKQVVNGKYTDLSLICNVSYSGGLPMIFTPITLDTAHKTLTNNSNGDKQGTRDQCIYLGKIVHFWEDDGTGSPIYYQQHMETFAIAASRLNSKGIPIASDTSSSAPFDQAAPTVIDPLTVETAVPYHISVKQMGLVDNTKEPTGTNTAFSPLAFPTKSFGVAFLQSLGTTNTPSDNGAQPASLYYVSSLTGNETNSTAVGQINGGVNIKPVPSDQEVILCLSDAQQYAYIEIGSANSQLQVKVRLIGETPCV